MPVNLGMELPRDLFKWKGERVVKRPMSSSVACIMAFILMVGGQAFGFNTPLTRWSWWEDPEARKAVGLTEEQTAKIRELVQSKREAMIDLRSAVEKKGVALDRELEKADFQIGRAMEAAEELQEARRELEKARTRLLLEIRDLLDQKQFFKVREMNMGPRMGGITVKKGTSPEQSR